MKLGNASQIIIGTRNLAASQGFYTKLGFRKIAEGNEPSPWMQVSDGALLILLSQEDRQYIGLGYFAAHMDEKVSLLEEKGIHVGERFDYGAQFIQGTFVSLEGLPVRLMNFDPTGLYQPKGKTMRHLSMDELRDPAAMPNHSIGVFGELSLPSVNLELSITFWEKLGFIVLHKNAQPYPWAIMADEHNILGLHQSQHIAGPTITYFAPDMKSRISRLREEGLNIEGFMDSSDSPANGILHTPEGQRIFLFSLF